MQTKSRLLLATAASVLILAGCNSQNAASSACTPTTPTADAAKKTDSSTKDSIVATVNGVGISESKLALLTKHFNSQNPGQAKSFPVSPP